MNLLDLAGLNHHPDFGPQAFANQVVMDRRGHQQRRDRHAVGVHATVRQDQDVVALVDDVGGLGTQCFQRRRHTGCAIGGWAAGVQGIGAEGRIDQMFDMTDFFQVDIRQDRLADLQAFVGAAGMQVEKIRPGADQGHQRHHRFLADRVDGRIGDLGKVLVEIVVKQFRTIRQHRRRNVPAHGPDRFLALGGHGREEELDIFLVVAEGLLTVQQGGVVRWHGRDLGRQVFQVDLSLVQPALVRLGAGQVRFQLIVIDDALLLKIDQQHLAGLQPPFFDDPFLRHRQHADFGAQDDDIVVGDDIACRTKPIAVERSADLAAVGKGDRRRPVPGLHQGGVVFVKGAAFGVHQRMPVPGLRDHDHHRMGQRVAAGNQ